jgi:hypothetical protein
MSIMGTVAAIGIASSVAGGVIQGNAAQTAAGQQISKAEQAQQLEQKNQQAGVNFQQNEWTGQQAAEQPYQTLGSTSANAYAKLINNPFTAPTLAQAEQTPGYQFNLQTGTQAIDAQAAATGNLNSGNTGVALTKFGQGLAQNTYQQAYQNALNSYTTNLNAAGQGVNTGLTSTGQLGQFGQSAANNLSNLYLTGGQQQASQLNNQGAAAAAGTMGQANAYANMANGIGKSVDTGVALGAYSNMANANAYSANEGTFNGGSVGGTADPGLGSPSPVNPYSTVAAPVPYSPTNLPGMNPGMGPSVWP